MGRITKDPQLTSNPKADNLGETKIVNFDIAVDNIRKNKDGTRGTTFLPVVCFNNIGENVVNHLHKGSKIAVKGAIQQRTYLAKDGTKRNVYEVIADSIEFLDPKPSQQEDDYDGAFDSCGSLDGEKYVDENGEEKELRANPPQPKFDPMTGKPLNPEKKK